MFCIVSDTMIQKKKIGGTYVIPAMLNTLKNFNKTQNSEETQSLMIMPMFKK